MNSVTPAAGLQSSQGRVGAQDLGEGTATMTRYRLGSGEWRRRERRERGPTSDAVLPARAPRPLSMPRIPGWAEMRSPRSGGRGLPGGSAPLQGRGRPF